MGGGEAMRILLAMDSFKGSLSSLEAAGAVAEGIHRVLPGAVIEAVPMADGGEGTVEALVAATGGKIIPVTVTGPLGTAVQAGLGMLPGGTAALEMAAASGLTLVPENLRDPRITTTFGTGELIRAALDNGATRIVLGIGGSATNDCGAGMAQALGVRLLDSEGKDLGPGGGQLDRLRTIDLSGLDQRVKQIKIEVACDVQNPLCGPRGASVIYGPQKGATPAMVEELDAKLGFFAACIKDQLGLDVAGRAGSGAAGGLGAGLMAFAGAELRSGVDLVLDTIKIDGLLQRSHLVITGEGQIDGQSAYGKVPAGVAARAAAYNLPVIVIAGSIGPGMDRMYRLGVSSVVAIANGPITLKEAMDRAYALTADAAERAFRLLKAGKKLERLL
jgi:glycerate kinase